MNKIILLLFAWLFYHFTSTAQKSVKVSRLDNYSTSWAARTDTEPFLLTAIPYKGKSDMVGENAPLDLAVSTSEYRYRSMTQNYRRLYTDDSSEVFFYAPNVFASNANQFEYRVLKNDKEIVQPWSNITQFIEGDLQLGTFKKNFAQLGGYKTTWDNFLTVELRLKGNNVVQSAVIVYWMQVKPVLLNIYTSNELNEFLQRLKKSYDLTLSEEDIEKWRKQYPASEIDPATSLPKKLVLQPTENNLIFYLKANIYKRDALEYQVEQDGKILHDWQPNDFDNNIIWLKNLTPGQFKLRMRFSRQRHNVAEYPFEIKPAWHQTTWFKIIMGSLVAASLGFIIVLFRLLKQKEKTAKEQSKKDKLSLELKAIHSQLNPHFVFNALTSIQGLINKNNIAGANKYLSKFGSLMRDSLTGSDKDLISLDKEIATLETYLSLEQLRFGFQYSIQVDDTINTSETDIPSLLLQPLAENAVKHGVATLEDKGVISITITRQNRDMVISITDNGAGFTDVENAGSYGLKLTRERIKLLNEILKEQAVAFTIAANTGSGAIIHLSFKNWL